MSVSTASSWQSYWQQAKDKNVCELGGTDHPAIEQFWHRFFRDARVGAKNASGCPRIIDIASGSGAVFGHLYSVVDEARCYPVCVDLSPDAVNAVVARWPAVSGIVADGAALPLAEHSAEIVTSQFGVEYAGIEAVRALLDIVGPGGRAGLLLHHRDGAIYRECADNYAALREVRENGFVEGAIEMFPHAFDVLEGGARAAYEETSRNLIPAFRDMERIMAQYGRHVAGGVIRQLYMDVNHIHSNLPRFNREEVVGWLQQTVTELDRYMERMNSMCRAALSAQSFETLTVDLANSGFDLLEAEALEGAGQAYPLAWSLVAEKVA
ncbi:class I SAM-dependent methyltransferase [Microbulbifer mangrovi]|uniref:class I SAM-dependent methyltransferase n=1 Tax=Microbulbifer mangrovi TaxID=927787 RepID=UPI0009905810|nr:class I SAM-dependent methyltransferase [Microbulbifer mangrovi]